MPKRALTVDDEFLKRIADNPFYQSTGVQKQIASQLENETDALEKEATKVSSLQAPPPPEKSSTERRNDARVERLQARAEKLQAANQERLAKEEAQAQEDARQKELARNQNIRASLQHNVQTVQSNVSDLADRIGSIQTVGGIGLLVAILVLLVFAIVQVNAQGDTRLKQFWYMLNGRAHLQGSVTPQGAIDPNVGAQPGNPLGLAPGTHTLSANVSGTPIGNLVASDYRTITG